jgi:predicted nucleic acid-binding protein
MIFADLGAGDSVFVDANTLIYYFGPDPVFGAACQQFMQRIETLQLHAFTSANALAEVAHQLMIIEASTLPGWTLGKVRQRLQQQPGVVQQLTLFRRSIETVLQSNLRILSLAPALLGDAVVLSQQQGLLTNDALTLAVMQANGLTKIASADTDFDRVPGITRYAPG